MRARLPDSGAEGGGPAVLDYGRIGSADRLLDARDPLDEQHQRARAPWRVDTRSLDTWALGHARFRAAHRNGAASASTDRSLP